MYQYLDYAQRKVTKKIEDKDSWKGKFDQEKIEKVERPEMEEEWMMVEEMGERERGIG